MLVCKYVGKEVCRNVRLNCVGKENIVGREIESESKVGREEVGGV